MRHDKDYPPVQVLTVEDFLKCNEIIDASPQLNPFAMAGREHKQHSQQEML